MELVPTCCGGTNLQKSAYRLKDGSMSEFEDTPCLSLCDTVDEQIDSIRWLLNQFIRCRADAFTLEDPYGENSGCDGCVYERGEMLNNILHLMDLVKKDGSS